MIGNKYLYSLYYKIGCCNTINTLKINFFTLVIKPNRMEVIKIVYLKSKIFPKTVVPSPPDPDP